MTPAKGKKNRIREMGFYIILTFQSKCLHRLEKFHYQDEKKLFAILGRPNLIRKDGNTISMRFDEENCLAYTYFDNNSDIKKVEYFEIRTKEGILIKNESDVSQCLNKLMQG